MILSSVSVRVGVEGGRPHPEGAARPKTHRQVCRFDGFGLEITVAVDAAPVTEQLGPGGNPHRAGQVGFKKEAALGHFPDRPHGRGNVITLENLALVRRQPRKGRQRGEVIPGLLPPPGGGHLQPLMRHLQGGRGESAQDQAVVPGVVDVPKGIEPPLPPGLAPHTGVEVSRNDGPGPLEATGQVMPQGPCRSRRGETHLALGIVQEVLGPTSRQVELKGILESGQVHLGIGAVVTDGGVGTLVTQRTGPATLAAMETQGGSNRNIPALPTTGAPGPPLLDPGVLAGPNRVVVCAVEGLVVIDESKIVVGPLAMSHDQTVEGAGLTRQDRSAPELAEGPRPQTDFGTRCPRSGDKIDRPGASDTAQVGRHHAPMHFDGRHPVQGEVFQGGQTVSGAVERHAVQEDPDLPGCRPAQRRHGRGTEPARATHLESGDGAQKFRGAAESGFLFEVDACDQAGGRG